METMLLAGKSPFDLDHLCSLSPADLSPTVEDKVSDLRLLMLKTPSSFVAQIQACDEEADEDTRADLRNILKDPPPEFVAALAENTLRFLIVTYAPKERERLQSVINTFVAEGLVQFDCGDEVRVLES